MCLISVGRGKISDVAQDRAMVVSPFLAAHNLYELLITFTVGITKLQRCVTHKCRIQCGQYSRQVGSLARVRGSA